MEGFRRHCLAPGLFLLSQAGAGAAVCNPGDAGLAFSTWKWPDPEYSGDLVPVQDGFDAQCLVLQLQPAVHGVGTASDSKMASKNVILSCNSASLKDRTAWEGSSAMGSWPLGAEGLPRAAEHPLIPGCGRIKWKLRPSCLLLLSMPTNLPLICDFGTSLHCTNNLPLGLMQVSLMPCSAALCYAWCLFQQLDKHRSLNQV